MTNNNINWAEIWEARTDSLMIENCISTKGMLRVTDSDLERELAAVLYERYDIDWLDIRVYTDAETNECRWVYIVTEDDANTTYTKRRIVKDFDLDDMEILVY